MTDESGQEIYLIFDYERRDPLTGDARLDPLGGRNMIHSYIALDLETTGLNPADRNRILEIGAVRVEDGKLQGHTIR